MAAQRGRPNENLSKLSTKDRAISYLNEHRWSVIGKYDNKMCHLYLNIVFSLNNRVLSLILGFSWVASMVGALGYTFSSKYLTTQQKVVQARMYAQAATIAVLLASAGLSIYSGEDRKKHSQCDEPDEQLRAVLNMPTTTQETQQTHQEQEKKVTSKNDHPEGKQRTTVDPPSQQEQQQRVASHKENLQSGSKQTANQGTDDAPEGKQRGYAEKLSSEEQLGRVASNKEDVWSSGKQLSNKQATSLETQGSNH